MNKKFIFLSLLILGTAFWGVSFGIVKIGITTQSPFVFLFHKFTLAAVALALVFHRQLQFITLNTWRIALLISLPLLAGTILQTVSLRYTSVTNSAFITGLDVVLIPLLKLVVYKKPVAAKSWLACGLAILGLYVITAQDGLSIKLGDLGTMAGALGFAFYVLQVSHVSNEKHPMPAVVLLMVVCGIGCGLMAFFDESRQWLPQEPGYWYGIGFAALFATAYMYSIQNMAQRYLAEEQVAFTYLFEPVFATLTGVLLLGERFTLQILLGGGFIVAAMVLTEVNVERIVSRLTSHSK